jgi:hypothetical protein
MITPTTRQLSPSRSSVTVSTSGSALFAKRVRNFTTSWPAGGAGRFSWQRKLREGGKGQQPECKCHGKTSDDEPGAPHAPSTGWRSLFIHMAGRSVLPDFPVPSEIGGRAGTSGLRLEQQPRSIRRRVARAFSVSPRKRSWFCVPLPDDPRKAGAVQPP